VTEPTELPHDVTPGPAASTPPPPESGIEPRPIELLSGSPDDRPTCPCAYNEAYHDNDDDDDVPGTAQIEAESTQGMSKPHDRPVQLSWLHEAVDILLEAARAYRASPMSAEQKTHGSNAYAQVKALMLAGWSAPQERTLAVPNGLVLCEEQWRALEDFEDVTVVLPGGQHVLTVRTAALHPRSHFQLGSELHDELWAWREEVAQEVSQPITTNDQRVTVPRSFLTNLVGFAHALREVGDYAAANSLDNLLAVIQSELRQFGISHIDHGKNALPEMNAQARVKHFLHALAYDPQLHDDVRAVLEYVSAGHKHSLTYGGYPDGRARRALGRLDDIEQATRPPLLGVRYDSKSHQWMRTHGEPSSRPQHIPFDGLRGQEQVDAYMKSYGRIYGKSPDAVPHPSTAEEDLRHQLGQRTDDCEKVREHLLPILRAHGQTRDEVAAPQPDTLRAGYIAKIAAQLLTWYAQELEDLRRNGVPGVIHEVDRAFYDLAVKERDLERAKVDRLEAELRSARDHITRLQTDIEESRRAERQLKGALESTQRGLVRMEEQRDELRAAICEAAGFELDKVNLIDTDFVTLAKLLARNEQTYDSEYDAVIAWAHPTKTQDES
jgi:FtsZ-binding cell division protein ZapB